MAFNAEHELAQIERLRQQIGYFEGAIKDSTQRRDGLQHILTGIDDQIAGYNAEIEFLQGDISNRLEMIEQMSEADA